MTEDENYEFMVESVENPGTVYRSDGPVQAAQKSRAFFVDVPNEDLNGDTLVYRTLDNHANNRFTVVAGYQESDIYENEGGVETVKVSRVPDEDREQVREIMRDLDAEEPININ